MQLRINPWITRVLACGLVLGALGAVSAPAQIVSAGAAFAVVRTASRLIPQIPNSLGNRQLRGDASIGVQEDGAGLISEEISEDANHDVNRRPRIQPIPEQRILEGQTLSFTVDATDPDGDDLSYGLETTEAGMAIDPNGGTVTWTPGPGSTGVYRVTVKATDDRGDLSQTDEEVVTIIVEGSNHRTEVSLPPYSAVRPRCRSTSS